MYIKTTYFFLKRNLYVNKMNMWALKRCVLYFIVGGRGYFTNIEYYRFIMIFQFQEKKEKEHLKRRILDGKAAKVSQRTYYQLS